VGAAPSRTCPECGSELGPAQRYCVGCGSCVGGRGPQLGELLERRRATRAAPAVEAAPPASTGGAVGALAASFGALRLPSAKASAVLVLAFLGFGVVLGDAAGNPPGAQLASARRPLRVLVAPSPAPGPSTTPPEATPAEGEPPASTPEPAPEGAPAPATAAPAAAPAKSTAPSASVSGPEGSQGASSGSSQGAGGGTPTKLPPVKHVFVIMLSDQPYAAVFGPSSVAHYLSSTLERKGELLVRYYAVAHEELANEIALLSGQGPTAETAANCPTYTDIAASRLGADGQVLGAGCVYPASAQTLPGQLAAKHLASRAYLQGIDEGAPGEGACARPAPGQPDPTLAAPTSAQPYATFRNPFVYFHSLADSPSCAAEDVGLSSLGRDLSDPSRTPSFAYIVPDRCHDGASACAPGAPSGLAAADGFLRQVVPEILSSKAYKKDGLLVITVDQAPSTGEFADSSSCCGQPQYPNLPPPAGALAGLPPNGGGQVGALLLSPFVKGATTDQEPHNHFSLLRTIEDLFGVGHLGYAGLSHVTSLEPSLFSTDKSP
jgi:phosphatidylinositol-3-phosphatase